MARFDDHPLIRSAGNLWREATTSPFLEGIGSGSLPRPAFERWLVQDYHFAGGLLGFQAVMTAKSPRPHQAVLIGGLAALESELRWFESNAGSRGLDLRAEIHPVCRRYTDFLIRTAYTEPFGILAVILFGVEASYLEAWSALEPKGPYAEFIERWSNPQFGEYVMVLSKMAGKTPVDAGRESFAEVLLHERDFWAMAHGG